MDEIFKPLLSGTTPSPPKFNVNVTWGALAPMDEKNKPLTYITFGNTRAETLRFGGAGVQHSACWRVWVFCPSTVVSIIAGMMMPIDWLILYAFKPPNTTNPLFFPKGHSSCWAKCGGVKGHSWTGSSLRATGPDQSVLSLVGGETVSWKRRIHGARIGKSWERFIWVGLKIGYSIP